MNNVYCSIGDSVRDKCYVHKGHSVNEYVYDNLRQDVGVTQRWHYGLLTLGDFDIFVA